MLYVEWVGAGSPPEDSELAATMPPPELVWTFRDVRHAWTDDNDYRLPVGDFDDVAWGGLPLVGDFVLTEVDGVDTVSSVLPATRPEVP